VGVGRCPARLARVDVTFFRLVVPADAQPVVRAVGKPARRVMSPWPNGQGLPSGWGLALCDGDGEGAARGRRRLPAAGRRAVGPTPPATEAADARRHL